MNNVQRRIRALVAKHQAAMGLAHWDITVRFDEIPKGAVGACESYPKSREATLRFNSKISSKRPHLIEHDVIHELGEVRISGMRNLAALLWQELEGYVFEHAAVDFERAPGLDKPARRRYCSPRLA